MTADALPTPDRRKRLEHIGAPGEALAQDPWLLPLNRQPRRRMAGDTKAPASLHQVGTALRWRVMPSQRESPSSKLSVKRMFPTARPILPFSTRKQPSRVRPVITA